MSLELRIALPRDAGAMAALEARVSAFPWSENLYRQSVRNHHCRVLADGSNTETIAGLLVYSRVVDEAELLNIVVDPARQGQGLGRRLMACLLDNNRDCARRVLLEVRESNVPAIGLYLAHGFVVSGRRKQYYPAVDGREDALIMTYDYQE